MIFQPSGRSRVLDQLETRVWKRTHRDHKTFSQDGRAMISVLAPNGATTLVWLGRLSYQQLSALIE
jgi:anti-sigma factor RsiW